MTTKIDGSIINRTGKKYMRLMENDGKLIEQRD